jgi:hypothetical protein
MKLFGIISLFIFSVNSAFALDISTLWDKKYRKKLTLSCSRGEAHYCETLCEASKLCVIEEKVCRNCIGTSIYLTHIFKEMGRGYRNSGEREGLDAVIDMLQTGKFVTLTSKSIYNHVTRYNDRKLRAKFQSLCPNGAEYPMVFFDRKRTGKIGEVRYVACATNGKIQVYAMSTDPEVVEKLNSLELN